MICIDWYKLINKLCGIDIKLMYGYELEFHFDRHNDSKELYF
jgi:hypothetical protein